MNTRSVTRAIVMQGVPSLLLACGASSFGDCEGLFGPSKAEKEAAELKKKLAEQEAELAKHKEELAKHVDYIAGLKKTLKNIPGLDKLDRNGDGKVDMEDLKAAQEDLRVVIGDKINEAVATGMPSQLSFGFISGWTSGFAAKRVSICLLSSHPCVCVTRLAVCAQIAKIVAVGVGGIFMFLQYLAHQGYIDVNMEQIQVDSMKKLDVNNDGKVDMEDAKVGIQMAIDYLSFNMPSGGGFAAGFLAGLRSG